MANPQTCTVCNKTFEPRFGFQIEKSDDGANYFCSQRCQQAHLGGRKGTVKCSCCAKEFKLEFTWQVAVGRSGRRYACTEVCRKSLDQGPAESTGRVGAARPEAVTEVRPQGVTRIAVFNHKGGTGKTTTAINLAAGLAERGRKVLLVDVDPQGNVGVSLGVRGERSLYHVLVLGVDPAEAAVPVRDNLHVLTSNETLAAAELYLAARPNRDRVLRARMSSTEGYDTVVLDCSPSLSLLNQNALCYADSVIIPVSCDYLALVGVKQCMNTLSKVYEHLKHPVQILGVVPTFYDSRHKMGREVTETLRSKFGELCLPTVRANMKLREAPASRKTIFEYAPDSHGAADYAAIVNAVLNATSRVGASAVNDTDVTPAEAVRVSRAMGGV